MKERHNEEMLGKKTIVVFVETMVMVYKREDGKAVNVAKQEQFEAVSPIGQDLQQLEKVIELQHVIE